MIVLTDNPNKQKEYVKILGRYAIRVKFKSPSEKPEDLLNDKTKFILRETSDLYNNITGKVSDKNVHLEPVCNISRLIIYYLDTNGNVKSNTYTHSVNGYIDLTKKEDLDVFGWDDIFVTLPLHVTYKEMSDKSLKNSARDFTISKFIEDHFNYEERVSLNFSPSSVERTISFDRSPVNLLKNNSIISNTFIYDFGIGSALATALHNGIMFKAAKNRRQGNYWLPGLNAGLPFVPKKDDVHEATFMTHDFMHFLIPDLVFTGKDDATHKQAYIIYRMMSEAVTLILADVFFVHTLQLSGINYDFGKRKIYPVFEKMISNQPITLDLIKNLCYANTRYALLGDKSLLNSMDINIPAFKEYTAKYDRFFIEDYKWTNANYNRLSEHENIALDWHRDYATPEKLHYCGLQSISQVEEFIRDMSVSNKIDVIFSIMWKKIETALTSELRISEVSSEECSLQAFKRYALGQSYMFSRFNHVQGMKNFGKNWIEKSFSLEESKYIKDLRYMYDSMIDVLVKFNQISPSDATTYKEFHPLFEPFFVFYESKKNTISSIEEAAFNFISDKEQ